MLEAEALMNIGPLMRSPEELPSARAVNKHPGIEEHRAQLLELRTESGTLYVCPSQWQRIHFLWTFRHFHVLSLQILSRRDQRLIDRLSRSALVKPPLPVARDEVFGVIEKVRTKSTESARRVVTQKTERVRPSFQEKPDMPDSPRPGLSDHERLFFEEPGPGNFQSVNDAESISIHKAVARMYGATDRGREGFRQWRALGMLIAVCIVVILARVYGVSLKPAPEPTLVVARKSAPAPSGSAGSITDSNSAGALSESAPTSPSGALKRLFLSELPQGQFVEPVVSDPNLVGEVHLSALIDADGSPPTVSAPMGQAAIGVSPPTVPLPGVENPKRMVTPLKPAPEPTLAEPTLVVTRKSAPVPSGSAGSITDSNSAGALSESAPTSPSGASERLLLSELPQGQFVEPVVSDPNLVGEVHLRALIDADGSPPTVSAPMGQAAIEVSPPTVPLPGVEEPKHTVTPLKPAPEPTLVARKSAPVPSGSAGSITDSNSAGALSESAPISPSGASKRLFLSELPQGQFVEPVVSDPNLVGEVHLRALIDADGSVKEVSVVSGNPKLAEAGMRAVRRWRYSPDQAPGGSSEGETLIMMRFFGPDSVSITSVAR